MAPKVGYSEELGPDEDLDLDDDELPDDEDEFLEEMGMAADGSRMQVGDVALNGRMWDPDGGHLD